MPNGFHRGLETSFDPLLAEEHRISDEQDGESGRFDSPVSQDLHERLVLLVLHDVMQGQVKGDAGLSLGFRNAVGKEVPAALASRIVVIIGWNRPRSPLRGGGCLVRGGFSRLAVDRASLSGPRILHHACDRQESLGQ